MSRFDQVLLSIQEADYRVKAQLLEMLTRVVQDIRHQKRTLSQEDKSAILSCCFTEAETMLRIIPNTESYKQKNYIFNCYFLIMGVIGSIINADSEISEKYRSVLQSLNELVLWEKFLESAITRVFAKETVDETDIGQICSMCQPLKEEFHRGVLYSQLLNQKDRLSKMTNAAKIRLSHHFTTEITRYCGLETLCEDCINNLELIADVSKYFADDVLIQALYEVLPLGHSCVNYYLVETFLFLGKEFSASVTDVLAKDLSYAKLTYDLMARYGVSEYFPKECASAEYLAKSDMVHWLLYPTELGQPPDAIEYLGTITYLFKKDIYYVFKFKSNSNTLDEDSKNKWLIGWASDNGGTFSNFDEYAQFEKKTLRATLRNIKRKLIG